MLHVVGHIIRQRVNQGIYRKPPSEICTYPTYIMSASPPKETEVEQGVQSPDDPDAQMNDPQDPHASGLGYEFEVKEQDRWLPIANG